MKKGISIWAFTDRTPDVLFPLAKKCGYDGVEMAVGPTGPITFDSTKEEMEALREKAASYGIEFYSLVCDICWDYSISSNDPKVRKKAEEIIIKQLEIASWLGCDTILVIAGMVENVKPGGEIVPYDVAYMRAFESISRLAKYAEKYDVNLAIENVGNKLLLSPLESRDFVDKVGSTKVKFYFDVGNVIKTGYPHHWIDILGSRIAKVHFKDNARIPETNGWKSVHLLQGMINYDEVMSAFARIGYDDWVTAEVFPKCEGDMEVLEINSAAMDQILKRL